MPFLFKTNTKIEADIQTNLHKLTNSQKNDEFIIVFLLIIVNSVFKYIINKHWRRKIY